MADSKPGGGTDGEEAGTYAGRDLEAMSAAVNYHAWILDEFAPFLGTSGAEMGAGSGSFAEILAGSGLARLVAFEPSPNMYELLERRFRNHPIVKTRQAFLADVASRYGETFDSVVYVNVLEHVEDDGRELKLAHQTLVRGGHLLLFVPALPILYSRFDRECGHFRRYRKKELTRRLEEAGFSVRKVKYVDLPGAFLWFAAFVLLKRSFTGGKVSAYDSLVVPLLRRIEQAIPPPFGKNLLCVARKT